MENMSSNINHERLDIGQTGGSSLPFPESTGNGSLEKLAIAESPSQRDSNVQNSEKSDDRIFDGAKRASERVSISDLEEQKYRFSQPDTVVNGSINKSQNGNVKESCHIGENDSQTNNSGLNTLIFDKHDPNRLRSLSEISEGSHTSFNSDNKDDTRVPEINIGRDFRINVFTNEGRNAVTGTDQVSPGFQGETLYPAQRVNSPSDKGQKEGEELDDGDTIIVSGNIRNAHSNDQLNTNGLSKTGMSPIQKLTFLGPAEIASESTPKPSDSTIFTFPSTKLSQNSTTFELPLPIGKPERLTSSQPSLTTVIPDNIHSTRASNTFLTEATVHNDQAIDSDIPKSLINLLYLTKPESLTLERPVNTSFTVKNPGFQPTNEGKRSNLKKKPVAATSVLTGPTASTTNSIDGSNSSLNKKSIKWNSSIPGIKNEPQSSPNVFKPPAQPTTKETALTCDGSLTRKTSPGQAPNFVDKDKKTSDSTPAEVTNGKDQAIRPETVVLVEPESRAIRGLKAGAEDKTGSNIKETDEDVISMGLVSSCGGLSTAGDMTPRDYLTDNDDTVTSFFEIGGKDKHGDATNTSKEQTQDEVFTDADVTLRNPPASRKSTKTRASFLPEVYRNSLVIILSVIYGITLVVLGLVLPLSETFANPEHPYFFEIFYLYLYAVSMAFLVYVYTYLLRKERIFLLNLPKTISKTFSRTFSRSSMRSRVSVTSDKGGRISVGSDKGGRISVGSDKGVPSAGRPLIRQNSDLSSYSLKRRKKIAYISEASKHTGSFYLRVGVIGFGIGSMIHSGLTFGHYFEVSHLGNQCSNIIEALKPFAHLCFTFVQMYFIFMNSKMCVHKYKTLARFGLMHMSCTNICVWLRSVVVETLQVIKAEQRESYNAMVQALEEHKKHSEEDSSEREPIQTLEEYLNEHKMGSMPEIMCRWDAMLGNIVDSSSTYLYPCIIEYSLVCACVLYVMWSNVGEGYTPKRMDSVPDFDTLDSDGESGDDNAHHRMSVDCAASSRGLFLGILLFVVSVVCVVCFYVLTSVTSHVSVGILLGHISEEIILIVAFMATVTAAFQMRHMRFTGKRKVGIEEILTLVSISGLGLYGIWSIIAAVFHLDSLHGRLTLITNLFMIIQAGCQATFTLAAIRASPRNHEQIREKPGRQCVTFLLICNFALFVVSTFETQRIDYNQTQVDFYGNTAWAIFSHISVPLGIYFRFNATVNLSIIWKKAWKKKDSHELN